MKKRAARDDSPPGDARKRKTALPARASRKRVTRDDGLDNDGDGKTDYNAPVMQQPNPETDPQCTGPADDDEAA